MSESSDAGQEYHDSEPGAVYPNNCCPCILQNAAYTDPVPLTRTNKRSASYYPETHLRFINLGAFDEGRCPLHFVMHMRVS